MLAGVLAAGYALLVFDPSLVSSFEGRRINNLGLMQDRQNVLIAGCVSAIIGIILIVASVESAPPRQSCAQPPIAWAATRSPSLPLLA